ncbi:MAG TPA: DUF4388 domain-containing protein [Thermoanaerobaculia bacterium]|nr:DUF4388 domain-containing protein [Thermoanaerobaculia bacterium]
MHQEEVQAALGDFQRYLLDQIPPLTVCDAIETLAQQPPELVMRQINAWAVEQSRIQSAALVDCLFHAINKIHVMGALKLLERPLIDGYLARLIPLALQLCPAGDREVLRSNLEAMKEARTITVSAVNLTRGGASPAAAKPGAPDSIVARSARRLSLVIDRLSRFLPGKPAAAANASAEPQPEVPAEQPAAQLVTMAAASARSEQELETYLETLKPYTGGEAQAGNLMRLLASSVPGWEITPAGNTKLQPSAPVQAMHKIITLTPGAMESAKRFRELLMTAIEQFNAGSLSPAVSMLELAEVVIVEKKIDALTLDRIRADAVDAISSEQLKKYTENKTRHALLRKALTFFPALTKETLLKELRGEERPERRRSLLGLLEAYGPAAREAALAELEAELKRPAEEIDTYYFRNLIYLLHRIVREADTPVDKEVELLTRASARGQSIYVIKEAVVPLGQIKTDASVRLLTTRLAEFEAMLLRSDQFYPAEEVQKLLDRIVAALARIGTPPALLTVARHGMKPNPLLGDSRSRLAALSQHDLSFDDQTVALLIKTIREELPGKLFGKILPKRQPPPVKLIEALSSTRSEGVESLFAEIAERFADQDIGRAASMALTNLAAAGKQVQPGETRAATLTGDLQFFGLTSVMQSLADSQATGILTLSNKIGQTVGKLLFLQGKFLEAQAGHLRAADAVYQLLERPVVGSFAFVPQPEAAVRSKNEPRDVLPLLLEGIRRHDELSQTSILVPADVMLRATSVKPTSDGEEADPAIIREVWLKASGGTRVAEWEGQIAADVYRVRKLLAHWLEEGALQPVAG